MKHDPESFRAPEPAPWQLQDDGRASFLALLVIMFVGMLGIGTTILGWM